MDDLRVGKGAELVQNEEQLALFRPLQFGKFNLSHRIVMAAMTRCRSYGNVPQPHAVLYYTQRATPGGLIISEANTANETSEGYPEMPGLWTTQQIEGWKPIVDAVKRQGAIFFAQLWHGGRVSHTSYQPNGARPKSSTSRGISTGSVFTADGHEEAYSEPEASSCSGDNGVPDNNPWADHHPDAYSRHLIPGQRRGSHKILSVFAKSSPAVLLFGLGQ